MFNTIPVPGRASIDMDSRSIAKNDAGFRITTILIDIVVFTSPPNEPCWPSVPLHGLHKFTWNHRAGGEPQPT